MPFGPTYTIIKSLASAALGTFFAKVQVEGSQFLPKEDEGPVLVLANHWNSAVDPAILSCYFPHGRKLHYWAKSTLFKIGIVKTILIDAGNIPVDRRNKDNQSLFASTFDMLKMGECVCIFPEGGSFTYPGFGNFKDGASWAALEYAKNVRMKGKTLSTGEEVKEDPKDVSICIVGITYTDKSKYRSRVLVQFGPSIAVTSYVDEFHSDAKSAVKKLTFAIQEALKKVTVNSPDWESLNSANMARKILWVDDKSIPLKSLRDISQMLIDHFSPTNLHPSPALLSLITLLLAYHNSLRQTRLTHYSLTGYALPPTLDPSIPYPLPTRFGVVFDLFLSSMSSLIRLPFFLLPLIIHLPIYIITKSSLRLSDFEEEFAQNKIALGLGLAASTYAGLFVLAWWVLFLVPFGSLIAAAAVWLVAIYHVRLIDNQYNAAKRLVASWRVLVGIWAPVAKSEAVAVLGLTEKVEGENEVRRVLRLRVEVSKALSDYLRGLEKDGSEEGEDGRLFVSSLRGWGARIVEEPAVGGGKEVKKVK